MKKSFVVAVVILLLLVIAGLGAAHAVSISEQARIEANLKLPQLIEILKNNAEHFEIERPEELERARIGRMYENFVLTEQYDSRKSVSDVLSQFQMFNFILEVDGRSVAEFQLVIQDGGEWDLLVGGNLPDKVNDKSKDIDHLLGESYKAMLVRFAGDTWLIANNGQKEVGYLLYPDGSTEAEVIPGQIYSEDRLRSAFSRKQVSFNERRAHRMAHPEEKELIGVRPLADPSPNLAQKRSVLDRLFLYARYYGQT